MSTNPSPLFLSSQIPDRKKPWGSYATSFVVQGSIVAALLIYAATAPVIAPMLDSHVELAPPPIGHTSQPEPVKEVKPRPLPQTKAPEIPAEPPKIETPVFQVKQVQRVQKLQPVAEVAQPVIPVAPKIDPKLLTSLPGPKSMPKVVTTANFAANSNSTLPSNTPANKVQTGGFGDPNGIPVNAKGVNRSIIAAAGSFDLPPGGGYGNGTGGTRGARGTVASTGFGTSNTTSGGNGHSQGHVQSTSAFNTTVAQPSEVRRVSAGPQASPVQIQSKPTPVYTSEARELRVEGEVLLNVVFTAEGRVRIVNVVRGLGHGLDEAAKRAAEGVRFNPAMRDGRPVDSNATLHIVFQLS